MTDSTAPSPVDYFEAAVRVRYCECDPMNVVHHSVYPIWMEIARTDMLARDGEAYADLEKQGVYFVVARLNLRYRKPAHYDDNLTVRTWITACSRAKMDHAYEIRRGDELIVTAQTTMVCVDKQGNVQVIPDNVGKLAR